VVLSIRGPQELAVAVLAVLALSLAGATAEAVSCSGLPNFATCTAYANGAAVRFNNHKYTAVASIPNNRDCPPSSPYDPSSDNWWRDDGVCDGGSATATATTAPRARATATATSRPGATATHTPTPSGGGGATLNTTHWHSVINKNSNKCVDVSAQGTADGTIIQQWTCNSSGAQLWKFQTTDSGYYRVMYYNRQSSGWDVAGGSGATGNGAKVHLWSISGSGATNQQWKPIDEGGGYYHFVARHSNRCLDVNAASTADGVQLQQWDCNNSAAQSFRLQVTSPPAATPTTPPGGGSGIGAVVSAGQFDQIWPPGTRAATYTYTDFVNASNQYYPALCGTGDINVKKRECAAYFANKNQETGTGRYDRELYCNPGGGGYLTAACNYCGGSSCGACASGQQYWGRHSIQLSWDSNYCLASGQIGTNLHADPNAIFNNRVTGWRLAAWYWMTQVGPYVAGWPTESAHDAITIADGSNHGFGGTIRAINGALECIVGNEKQRNRVVFYNGSGSSGDEDGSGGVLGVLGYGGGVFGRRYCAE
jgi:hypothetical protein